MHEVNPAYIKAIFVNTPQRHTLSLPPYQRAAVLVPLIWQGGQFTFLFTKRTDSVETHKGQISFPGGVVDAGDVDDIHAALREAHEEIGLPPSSVEVVGVLDDVPTPTGFVITPVVSIIRKLPPLTPNSDEVSEVFEVPLAFFTDPTSGRTELREVGGKHYEVWFYEHAHHLIWGATAMIVRMLLKKLQLVQ